MKKQFFRVKQLADQAIARAEKSEVLTEDLAAKELRVEALRSSCSLIRKRLVEGLSGHGADEEKRLRKIPEHQLGAAMKEGSAMVGPETTLGVILGQCSNAETSLAQERLQFEKQLETTILENSILEQLLETDIPNVTKLRKTLARLTLDMDASRSRYQNAQRHSAGTAAPGSQQKTDAIREELETAQTKVEQHRDMLADDMLQLLQREPELAQLMLQLVQLQMAHHRECLQLLETMVPRLQASLDAMDQKPVFGLSLEEHLQLTEREIALPLEMCVCRLLQIGAEEEGLFRVAGSTSRVRKLKSCFDARLVDPTHMLEYLDPHVVADALKAYLRGLPQPLMTTELYDDWMQAARVQEEGARLQALWQVLHQLPPANYANLRYLIKFLAFLCKNKDINKMSTQNMAIVMAPNLLWSPGPAEVMNMTATGTHSLVVDALIAHADWFFSEDVEFFLTYPRELAAELSPRPVADSPPGTPAAAAVPAAGSCNGPAAAAAAVAGVVSAAARAHVYTPGHQRSRSSDTSAAAAAAAACAADAGAAEPLHGSTPSLGSDHSPPSCDSPKPTLRRKKQAAPAPPAHRQTIGAALSSASKSQPHKPESQPPGIGFEPLARTVEAEMKNFNATSRETLREDSVGNAAVGSVTPPAVAAPTVAPATAGGVEGTQLHGGVSVVSAAPPEARLFTEQPLWTSPQHIVTSSQHSVASPLPSMTSSQHKKVTPSGATSERHPSQGDKPPVAAEKPHLSGERHVYAAAHLAGERPVPAPRGPLLQSLAQSSPAKSQTRPPDRPPPPAKAVERAASFSDGGASQRTKPALPERPGTLRRTAVANQRLSAEQPATKDAASPDVRQHESAVPTEGSAATSTASEPMRAPPPQQQEQQQQQQQQQRTKPSTAPPPVPAPRACADSTHL